MGLRDTIQRLIGYRLGGGAFTNMEIPAGWNYQSYLKAYGEIGWLFGAVSLIANAVASSEWDLYSIDSKGEYEIVDTHPLLDLQRYVNPFQTWYQFMLQLETYIELVGEAFIVLSFSGLRIPAEMWLASPANMKVIASPDKYIDHYEFERSGTKVVLQIPEVIHIFNPNPINPYRGIGAAKSIATDLDSEFYASRYQNKLFFNDATPRLFLEFPTLPPKEERGRLRDEFLDVHQGWRNAYKPAFLWGGAKATSVALNSREMDFARLRTLSKKVILAAYHIPESLIGASEVGSRARAEADEYVFSKYTVKPALQRIKEAFNEQLCPLFDEGLEFDYEDPVPEDVATIRDQNRQDFAAGIITREEARAVIGMDAEATGTFVMPIAVVEVPAGQPKPPPPEQTLSQRKRMGEEQKEALWRGYAAKTEREEKRFIDELKSLWTDQKREVVKRLKNAENAEDALFDQEEAKETFDKSMRPILTDVFEAHYNDAIDLVKPRNPHAESKQLDELALLWLETESLKMAKLINGTTIEQLRATLTEGFSLGESISKLTRRVTEYYGMANRVRATTVARTETIAAAVEGNLQGFEKVDVHEVEWYTALDAGSMDCDICGPEHGNIYTLKQSYGLLPAHPNCRCVFVPVVE